jgi:hypothetical protein
MRVRFLLQGGNVRATIGLMMMLLLSTAAHGQLVKCIGKDGKVEYANQCPPGSKEQATGIRSGSAPPSTPSDGEQAQKGKPEGQKDKPDAQKSLAERDAEFRKRRIEMQEAEAKNAKKTAEDEQRKRACDDARAYLKNLEARNRVVKFDPKTGERVYLEEAQYASETAAAQRSIEANCK